MVVLTIGIIVIVLLQVFVLIIGIQKLPVVKAGDVHETCSSNKWGINLRRNNLVVNGEAISVDGFSQYLVHGRSMQPFGVDDNEIVFVESMSYKQLTNQKNFYPIAVFKYATTEKNDCDIKLRKYLSQVKLSGLDIEALHKQYGKYLPLEEFKSELENRIEELKKEDPQLTGDYILSVTYRYKLIPAKYHYSIHNARKLQGIVRYAA